MAEVSLSVDKNCGRGGGGGGCAGSTGYGSGNGTGTTGFGTIGSAGVTGVAGLGAGVSGFVGLGSGGGITGLAGSDGFVPGVFACVFENCATAIVAKSYFLPIASALPEVTAVETIFVYMASMIMYMISIVTANDISQISRFVACRYIFISSIK